MKALLSATEPVKPEPSGALVSAPAKAEKPYWYRAPDSKARKLFEKIAVMRTAGRHDAEIAKRLGTTEQTVRTTVYLAKKNGWCDDDGEPIDIEAELSMDVDRKIVRNISKSLDGEMTNWQTHEMTIAAAKGRGHFKNHDKAEGGPAQLPVVAIRIEMPSLGMADHNIIEANVGGTPAYFEEGEIVNGIEEPGTAACLPAASSGEAETREPSEVLPAASGR
jgi:Transcriptional regulator, contains sigma factor-related N-terminal domain